MKRIEIAGLSILVLLIIHRVLFGMDLHVVLRVSITLLSIFYMWFGIFIFNRLSLLGIIDRKKRSALSVLKIVTSITAGFIYSFSLIAILFAVDFFGKIDRVLFIALFINFSVVLIATYYSRKLVSEKAFLNQFVIRSVFFTAILFIAWITPLQKRMAILYKDYPTFIEAYQDYLQNPDDPDALERLREERSGFR